MHLCTRLPPKFEDCRQEEAGPAVFTPLCLSKRHSILIINEDDLSLRSNHQRAVETLLCEFGAPINHLTICFDFNVTHASTMGTARPKAVRSPALTRKQGRKRIERGRSLTLRVVARIAPVFHRTQYWRATLLVSVQVGRRLSNKYDLEKSPTQTKSVRETLVGLSCENPELGPCCASWEYEHGDDWWVQHPDFEVSHENQTTFCFSKIQDSAKADFFRRIHQVQWNVSNCSNVLQRQQINSGWAASFGRVADALWAAVHYDQPVQMTKHWEGMQWLYATNDTNSWAFCPARDMTCYLLPLSPCPQVIGKNDDVRKTWWKERID